ncbi:carbohydrate ABC transporter permease [Kineococcus sp. SYSU DK006]|uniref:carbohydrate ABC transporter permease n=1 Tax=Kineococcus sp. SYSU DK006 TaxID=3383127 RepID=UPI003D7E455E
MAAQTSLAPSTSAEPTRRARSRKLAGFLFVLPFLVVYVAFLVWPVLAGLWDSFFNVSLAGGDSAFLGLANYAEMIGDEAVWRSLWHTIAFTLLSSPPLVLLGLAMALLTHRARRAGWFLRFAYFVPYVLPATVVSLVWVWLYQPGFGLINDALTRIGLAEVNWLGDERVAMIAVVLTTVWWTVGFNFLLYLAALQSIPAELYEASSIDGARPLRQLVSITLPLLSRTTGLVLVLQLVASLKVFDQIYLMTAGGPNFSTRPIIQYIYETGFTTFRIGYASAVSYMFFALIVIISIAQFKFGRSKEQTS